MTTKRNLLPIVLPIALLATALPAAAQLHESVSVEGTYIKDILHPEKISQLPRLMPFRVGETPLEYASGGVKAAFTPLSPTLAATARGADRSDDPSLGYIDLRAGSWLDASLAFGIGILRESDRRLDLRLRHNSTSLWRPFGDAADPRKSYDENLGLSFTQYFSDLGSISASAQYHVGYFNYYGIDPGVATPAPALLQTLRRSNPHMSQTLNDAALKVEWNSDPRAGGGLRWGAGAGVRYFGYRTATRETDVNLFGNVSAPIGTGGRVGVDASLHTLVYSESDRIPALEAPRGYTTLSLTPYYKWQRGNLSLKIGADIDLAFNADGNEAGSNYGALHASPEVRFDLTGRNVGFFIHLLGGTELHTLAAMAQIDPYRNPHLESTQPVHTPLDARIGVNLTPFRGFEAELALQYKSTNRVPMEGWYMAALNYGDAAMPGLGVPAGASPDYGMALRRYSLSGLGASLRLAYSPSRVLRIGASGSYTPQRDKTGIFNGLDRPRWVLNAALELRPVPQFGIGVDYAYRGVRRIYTGYTGEAVVEPVPGGSEPDMNPEPRMEIASLRLPDITCLSAHAEWTVTRGVTLRVDACNLLGQRAVILPMTPTPGITVTGGVQWLF